MKEQRSGVTGGTWWLLPLRGKELAPTAAGFVWDLTSKPNSTPQEGVCQRENEIGEIPKISTLD